MTLLVTDLTVFIDDDLDTSKTEILSDNHLMQYPRCIVRQNCVESEMDETGFNTGDMISVTRWVTDEDGQ